MPKIKLNDLDYGGSPTVEDADHLMVADTRNQTLSAQNIITNILGDMAQLEHNATASKAYAKGEYLVLGSYFYKATTDIAQGDTLVAGTNIEQTNVGAEMSELNSKRFPDYSHLITSITNSGSWTATEDCYMQFAGYGTNTTHASVEVNNTSVGSSYNYQNSWSSVIFWMPIKTGDLISMSRTGSDGIGVCKFFKLR